MSDNPSPLRRLGIYGYDAVEPILLAALVSEDPLLLIGKAGTGKTLLLNQLSASLELVHRHYNASLISFDDLVGFPMPDEARKNIHYLPTPATVWGAESVLIDEINRCKPEHQNRLFSLIHECRIQGIRVEKLRYRWAAMNPSEGGGEESYDGAYPLDAALADRFAYVLNVPDWAAMEESDKRKIAKPLGTPAAADTTTLPHEIEEARKRFQALLLDPPTAVTTYAVYAADLFAEAGLRLSPRRVRQLSRNLCAIMALRNSAPRDADFRLCLTWSLPQRASGKAPLDEVVHGVHRTAWGEAVTPDVDTWLAALIASKDLSLRVRKLLTKPRPADDITLAVTRLLGLMDPPRRLAFAFALYPAALEGRFPITREGVSELGKNAAPVLEASAETLWREPRGHQNKHPDAENYQAVLEKLEGHREARARQLFSALLRQHISIPNPEKYEKEFHQCIFLLGKRNPSA